jgi:hypothetical protein
LIELICIDDFVEGEEFQFDRLLALRMGQHWPVGEANLHAGGEVQIVCTIASTRVIKCHGSALRHHRPTPFSVSSAQEIAQFGHFRCSASARFG